MNSNLGWNNLRFNILYNIIVATIQMRQVIHTKVHCSFSIPHYYVEHEGFRMVVPFFEYLKMK